MTSWKSAVWMLVVLLGWDGSVIAAGPPQPRNPHFVEYGRLTAEGRTLSAVMFSTDGRTLASGQGPRAELVLYEAASLLKRGSVPLPARLRQPQGSSLDHSLLN